MQILIEANGTHVAREVADMDEAQRLANRGSVVLIPNKDGGHRVLAPMESKPRAGRRFAAAPKQ